MKLVIRIAVVIHCVLCGPTWADAPALDIPGALQHCRKGAQWVLNGEEYSGLVWIADGQGGGKPTLAELNTAWQEVLAVRAARKIWTDAGAFLQEFTLEEIAAIELSTNPTVAALRLILTSWSGEVWSDDPLGGGRVMTGLNALVSAGIITEQRKTEVLAK